MGEEGAGLGGGHITGTSLAVKKTEEGVQVGVGKRQQMGNMETGG